MFDQAFYGATLGAAELVLPVVAGVRSFEGTISKPLPEGVLLRVTKTRDGWLWVGGGWVERNKTVRMDQALDYFSKQIRLHPTPFLLTSRSRVWIELEQLDRALVDCAAAHRINARYAPAFRTRGQAYLSKGDLPAAMAALDQALQLDPRVASSYCCRAEAWLKSGEFENARADATEAIELDPRLLPAYAHRARAYSAVGDYENAIRDYGSVIELDSSYISAFNNRANAYFRIEKHEEAVKDYSRALELRARADIFQNRALARMRLGDKDGALEDLNAAIRNDSKFAPAYFYRAQLQFEKGRHSQAVRDLEHVDILSARKTSQAIDRRSSFKIDRAK